jgi:hypothetical protein
MDRFCVVDYQRSKILREDSIGNLKAHLYRRPLPGYNVISFISFLPFLSD